MSKLLDTSKLNNTKWKKEVGEKAKLQESLFLLADVNDIWYKVIKQVVYRLWQSNNESTSLYHNVFVNNPSDSKSSSVVPNVCKLSCQWSWTWISSHSVNLSESSVIFDRILHIVLLRVGNKKHVRLVYLIRSPCIIMKFKRISFIQLALNHKCSSHSEK